MVKNETHTCNFCKYKEEKEMIGFDEYWKDQAEDGVGDYGHRLTAHQAWNKSERQAIEHTKAACIKAIRQLEGADCDYIYYEDNPEYITKDDAISAIRTVDQ